MIEEITLPANAGLSGDKALPVPNYFLHADLGSEGREHMQVVGHQHEKRNSPQMPIPIEARRCEQCLRDIRVAELILAFGLATNRNERNHVRCSDKMRRIMQQRTTSDRLIFMARPNSIRRTPRRVASLPGYFFISSSTAFVIPINPVRIVGSGTGANLLECKLGRGAPVFLLSAAFAGSTAPTLNMNAGIE
jgi:hypothetical protein